MNIKSFLINSLSSRLVTASVKYARKVTGLGSLRIINFHRVLDENISKSDYRSLGGNPTESEFENIISYLKRNYSLISLKDYIANHQSLKKGELYVAITFDDGYLDNFTNAIPILEKHSAPASIFVSLDALDGKMMWFQKVYCAINKYKEKSLLNPVTNEVLDLENKWNVMQSITNSMKNQDIQQVNDSVSRVLEQCNLKDDNFACDNEEMMAWEELARIKGNNLIDIGAHAISHSPLVDLDDAQLRKELIVPYQELSTFMEYERMHLAYPNGKYDLRVKKAAMEAGYEAALTMKRGKNSQILDRYEMKREYVMNDPRRIAIQLSNWDIRLKKLSII